MKKILKIYMNVYAHKHTHTHTHDIKQSPNESTVGKRFHPYV